MQGIVLTKSRMNAHGASGVCTVVYSLDDNKMVRIVSNKKGAPIPNPSYDCLDIISVDIIEHCPIPPQEENYLVDINSIHVIGKFEQGLDKLFDLVTHATNQECPTRYMDDYSYAIESEMIHLYNHSIEMIRVHDFFVWGQEDNGKVKTVAGFKNTRYKQYPKYYSVTDNNYRIINGNELTRIGDAYIIVSISYEPMGAKNQYFKFIAAVYPIDNP